MKEEKPGYTRVHPEQSSLMSLVSGWMQQGFENFIATQRILVELAMRQNANAIDAIQKRLSDKEVCPVAIMSEFAGEGISNFIEAQKVLLSLAQRENEIIMNGVKERVGISSILSAMTDFFRRGVDNFLEMNQGFLKIAGKQTDNWLEATKAGKGYDPAMLMGMAQEGMENFVRWQKKFLDAQKKLLDVAGKQIDTNVKTAGRTLKMMNPLPFIPIGDITREGVRNFVDAEKALIDTMMKKSTKGPIKAEGRAKPRAKKAVKRPRPMTQVAVAD